MKRAVSLFLISSGLALFPTARASAVWPAETSLEQSPTPAPADRQPLPKTDFENPRAIVANLAEDERQLKSLVAEIKKDEEELKTLLNRTQRATSEKDKSKTP